jgi:SAM-dependent methyltransferase
MPNMPPIPCAGKGNKPAAVVKMDESGLEEIRAAYGRRSGTEALYDPLLPPNVRMHVERARIQAAMIRQWLGSKRLSDIDILEMGCGTGNNILHLIALGARPDRIVGNELLETRIKAAKFRLPSAVRLQLGDGSHLPDSYGPFDLILQFVVFSSILDESLLTRLASRMWSVLKPGGIVLSYDFVVDNPANPDVRGIPLRKLKALFPEGQFTAKSLTVAPPVTRRISHRLYPVVALIPLLKTHCLCAIRKRA